MNDQLRNKMYDYEFTPPPGAWENIAAELNEQEKNSGISSKLYHLEVPPPTSAWGQIKESLEKEEVIPVSNPGTVIHILRYAAAVVIFALMIWGAMSLFQTKHGKKETATNRIVPPERDSSTPITNESSSSYNSGETNEKSDDSALEESKHTVAKNDFSISSKLKLPIESYSSAPALYIENMPDATGNNPTLLYSDILRSLFGIGPSNDDISDRYITLKDPEGNYFRMSKKLSDLICCISGEEQDSECKDKLQRWREKIASSPLAPSPGNFMDILSLITSLQEDKK